MSTKFTSSGKGIDQIKADMQKLMQTDVYVGIPQEKASRPGEPVNNAELAYIQTNGSELQNIPARPIIEPIIEKNKDLIGEYMKQAGKLILTGDTAQGMNKLEEIGLRISTKIKDNFMDPNNGWAENKASTIKAKGSDRPLIDTASMLNSITYIVGDKN
jgi:hypothetical protein